MGKFRIKVNVELVECDDPLNQEPTKNSNSRRKAFFRGYPHQHPNCREFM